MPLLSIIVPVFRKEAFLPKCINSLLAQSVQDIEILLIDDGSPDRCGEICDEYAARDPRITVIHQENLGVSAARNAGLDIAAGEYIGFVDADDWVSPEMYETLVKTAAASGAEIAACGITVWNEEGRILRRLLESQRVYSRREMLEELFGTPDQLGGTCCNKIFRRNAVEGLRFPVGVAMCEDRIYLLQCYAASSKCVKISSTLSQVVETSSSATRSGSIAPFFSILSSSRRMIRLAVKIDVSLRAKAVNRYLDDSVRYLRLIKKTAQTSREAWKLRSIPHWLTALGWISRCYLSHTLPRNRLRGYLRDLFHIQ